MKPPAKLPIARILLLLLLLALITGACLPTSKSTPAPEGYASTVAAQTWQAMQALKPTLPATATSAAPDGGAQDPAVMPSLTPTPTYVPANGVAAAASPTSYLPPTEMGPLTAIPAAPTLTPVPTKPPKVAAEVGGLAPDFTLVDARTGNKVQLSQLRGYPVLIFFWATWCGYCQKTLPAIQSTYDKYKERGFLVLAVDAKESRKTVANYGNSAGLAFNLLLDSNGGVGKQYHVTGYPTSFFLDRGGVIKSIRIGSMSQSDLERYVSPICK